MTDEEMRRTMESILQQQAQFTVDIQQVREVQEQQQQQIGRLAEAILAVTGIVGRLGDAQERTERRFAALAEAQVRTDERLNTFIGVVERYISEHRNGNH